MTTPTPSRPPGRPLDPELATRFIQAGVELIAERGLHRLNTDVLAARIHAGKAGFYRRWPDMDHYLADVARTVAAVPVAYPQPRTLRTDLHALVVHQVAGDRGLVVAELLPRLPRSSVLRDAWTAPDGPNGQLFLAVETLLEGLGIQLDPRLHRGLDLAIAGLREHVLVTGAQFAYAVPLAQRDVDELLASLHARWAA